MRLVTNSYLKMLRRINEENLLETLKVYRTPKTIIPGGFVQEGELELLYTVPCRMSPVVKAYRTVETYINADQLEGSNYFLVVTAYDFEGPEINDIFVVEGERGWVKELLLLGTTGPSTNDIRKIWVCKLYND
jgi:hypothetical protein